MKTLLNPETRRLLDDSWRLTPARMAEHLTHGRFQRYRHVRFLERKLAQAIGRGGARLIISMPPRHGKSWLASLFTPAWFVSLWPERKVILTSHDAGLASAWGRGVRDFLREHRAELSLKHGCEIVTAAVGGHISGHGGHLLVVDDPLRSWADASSDYVRRRQIEWFNSTFYTRAEPGASIVVIMTRWHEEDLAGYLQTEHGDQWEVLRIPALADQADPLGRPLGAALCEERYGPDALAKIRANVGRRVWNALYLQMPADEVASALKRQWWRYYRAMPEHFDELVQSWDVAFKGGQTSDYVVGQVWGRIGPRKFLLDQIRGKLDFPASLEAVRELSRRYPQAERKLIEDKANGSALISMLKNSVAGLIAVEPSGGKRARLDAVSAEIEGGSVYLPDPTHSRWVGEFVDECAGFPNVKHDDQVDAMAQALMALKKGE